MDFNLLKLSLFLFSSDGGFFLLGHDPYATPFLESSRIFVLNNVPHNGRGERTLKSEQEGRAVGHLADGPANRVISIMCLGFYFKFRCRLDGLLLILN